MQCPNCGGSGTAVRESDLCGSCKGEGRVKEKKEIDIDVPAGVDTGERLRVVGRGDAGRGDAGTGDAGTGSHSHGDLYVQIRVSPPAPSESHFKRQGSEILTEISVPFYDAILGASVQVPTLKGPTKLSVPPGTQPNTRKVLRGFGVQKLSQPPGVCGDQVVILNVSLPKTQNLTEEQMKLLEKYREITRPKTAANDSNASDGILKKTFDKLKDRLCEDKSDKKSDKDAKEQ